MDDTETGRKCKEYLERIIGDRVEGNELICWPHKSKLQVTDIEIFNEIAKKCKIDKLKNLGGFYYYINIPANDNYQDNWTVALDSELRKEFLTKYGKDYKIN